MRTELLGLEKLPELPNEEKEKMSALGLGILEKPKPMLEGPHGKLETCLFNSFLFNSYILSKPERVFGLQVRFRELDIFKILEIF